MKIVNLSNGLIYLPISPKPSAQIPTITQFHQPGGRETHWGTYAYLVLTVISKSPAA